MCIPPRRLASHPQLRDLLGVAVYALSVTVIAVAVYAGVQAVAPVVASGAMSASDALDRWAQSDDGPSRRDSNFQRWLADREPARHPQPAEAAEPSLSAPVLSGPVGVAAAAKARAQAEMGSRRRSQARPRDAQDDARDDVALPFAAQPAEQTGHVPPAVDKHWVY